jgi:hypothetical protein
MGLQTQTSLKHEQYPKTITNASNILSNHRWDNAGNTNHTNPKENNTKGENNKSEESPEIPSQCWRENAIVAVKTRS